MAHRTARNFRLVFDVPAFVPQSRFGNESCDDQNLLLRNRFPSHALPRISLSLLINQVPTLPVGPDIYYPELVAG